MRRELLHIYGPFAIQSYGLAIIIGLCVFNYFFLRNPKRATLISVDAYVTLLVYAIISALLGGRLLAMMYHLPHISLIDFISPLDGGFSLLGSIIALLIMLPLYLSYHRIPVMPFLDLASLYAPLLQSVARIGCFFAGCCFGQPSTMPWAISYSDSTSYAPLHIALHPTQLYSSLLLFLLFIALHIFYKTGYKKQGEIFMLYLMGMSIERFAVDFFRADRELLSQGSLFSLHQWITMSIFTLACAGFVYIQKKYSHKEHSLS